MSTCIVILNSARSGSSLLAGMLVKAGLFISDDVLKPNVFNPNGFFEDNKIRDFNTKVHNLCRVFDPTWNSAFSLPAGWLNSKEINCVIYNDLRNYIAETYAKNNYFLIKEPSIIRLMYLYDKIFTELGITAKYIHLVRHPVEYMFDYKWAFPEVPYPNILWNYVKYNIEAENFTRYKQLNSESDIRYFLTFNRLYEQDKMDLLREIGENLDIELLKFKDDRLFNTVNENISDFFKPDIRKFKKEEDDFKDLPNLFISQYAREFYEISRSTTSMRNEFIYSKLDMIDRKLNGMESKCRMNNLGERTIQII